MVLQLKEGHLDDRYFQQKFGVDILQEFAPVLQKLQDEGWLERRSDKIQMTPAGLLQVDRHLPNFFDPQYISQRYT